MNINNSINQDLTGEHQSLQAPSCQPRAFSCSCGAWSRRFYGGVTVSDPLVEYLYQLLVIEISDEGYLNDNLLE